LSFLLFGVCLKKNFKIFLLFGFFLNHFNPPPPPPPNGKRLRRDQRARKQNGSREGQSPYL
jgi:hypothetical protein